MRRRGLSSAAAVGLVASGLVAAVLLAVWWSGWPGGREGAAGNVRPAAAALKPSPGLPWFVDVTRAAGIDFIHFDSATPSHYIQETMGSGVAWIDYDGDGLWDLFLVQDGPIRPEAAGGDLPTHRLYRNRGDGTFEDVTRQAGLAVGGYGQGCAVGDYDNDGYDDLVVTYWGGIALYHNEPDGRGGRRFVDVTARSGLRDPHWATSCAWGDIDGDGFLDLYVCNYVEVDLSAYPDCTDPRTRLPAACTPNVFPHTAHRLFRNRGDGTFEDVTASSGVGAVTPAPGLGVVMADLDEDGRLDVYVANDMKPSYLFHNQGGGKLVERAGLSGCALGPLGALMAGMGVDAGDVDGSGRPSLFVTNFYNKPNVLFLNLGGLRFQDWTHQSGLGPPSIHKLGFGTVFADLDLDGEIDVVVVNGHLHRHAKQILGIPMAEEAQVFQGQGQAKFRDVSHEAGAYFHEERVGRGLAWADFDNDGRPDLAINNCGGAAVLLHNRTEPARSWVRLELVGDGRKSNRNAIGARVTVEAGGRRQVRTINGGGSYLSASDRRLLVGLGDSDRVDRVSVVWPSGARQEFRDLAVRKGYRLVEGVGEAQAGRPQERPSR